jgi:hypothetical protein
MFSAPGSFVRIAAANLRPVPPTDDDLEPFRRRMQNAPTGFIIPGFFAGIVGLSLAMWCGVNCGV